MLILNGNLIKEAGCLTNLPSDLPKILRYHFLSYKLLVRKEKNP